MEVLNCHFKIRKKMLLAINSTVVILAAVVFTLVIILLVTMLVVAAQRLVNSGAVKLTINGERVVEVEAGGTLLGALQQANLFLPSACGGGGTCAMCKCQVHEGGGDILPTETGH
ncbi:MAG: Na+-transporting NADH:ubiquinone oxidoreductase subunit F, partial [Bacteroidia bacterium]